MGHDYGAGIIIRATDTWSGTTAIIHSDEELRQTLEGWEDTSEPDVAEAIAALLDGTRDADVLDLGVTIDELDPDDREQVTDDEWAAWICGGWLADGRRWDDGRAIIDSYRPPVEIGGRWEWQGGPVSVRSWHGDQERRWRHVTSLADLRDAVDTAHAEEQEWRDEQVATAEARRAGLRPLRLIQAGMEQAQRQAASKLAERDAMIRRLIVTGGYSGAEIARALGISEKQISVIRNR